MKNLIKVLIVLIYLFSYLNSYSEYDEEDAKKNFSRSIYFEQAKKKYDFIDDNISDTGLIRVSYKSKWGLIDRTGKEDSN
jgi:hypothetical protein